VRFSVPHDRLKKEKEIDEQTSLLAERVSKRSARSFKKDPNLGRTIGWVSVAFITFFNVSGGPWGSEMVVSSMGPFYGLLGITVFALCLGVPMILVTSELSSMFPDDGGYSIWVSEAFGEFWGFQLSYWSWVAGTMDNCLYPVITFRLAEALLFPGVVGFWSSWLCKSVLAVAFSIPNFFLIDELGKGLAVVFVVVIFPFIILSVNGFLHGDFRRILEVRDVSSGSEGAYKSWVNLINVLYWNVSGFDCISTCSGEIKNPGFSILMGLFTCLVMIYLSYIIPLAATTAVDKPPWQGWHEGTFSVIAREQMGSWLASILLFAGLIGNMGMHVAELFEDTWQLCGMAQCGLAPSIFGYKDPKYKTPTLAIAFSLTIMVVMVALPFEKLLMIDNFFSVASGLLEYSSFLKLRYSDPLALRPYRVPMGFTGCAAMLSVAMSLTCVVLFSSLFSTLFHFLVNTCAVAFGLLLYVLHKYSNGTLWKEWEEKKAKKVAEEKRVQDRKKYDKIVAIAEAQNSGKILPIQSKITARTNVKVKKGAKERNVLKKSKHRRRKGATPTNLGKSGSNSDGDSIRSGSPAPPNMPDGPNP